MSNPLEDHKKIVPALDIEQDPLDTDNPSMPNMAGASYEAGRGYHPDSKHPVDKVSNAIKNSGASEKGVAWALSAFVGLAKIFGITMGLVAVVPWWVIKVFFHILTGASKRGGEEHRPQISRSDAAKIKKSLNDM